MTHQMDRKAMIDYREYLQREEYSDGTIQKYLRDIRTFATWKAKREEGENATVDMNLESSETDMAEKTIQYRRDTYMAQEKEFDGKIMVDKEAVTGWKAYLVEAGYAPVTVNSMLSSLNGFLGFLGWGECKVKFLKIQRRTFRDQDRELSRAEYQRLLESAGKLGNSRLAMLLESICGTGIRVSEVKYITMEALKQKRADISLKGKIRTILLPGKLCKKLKAYAKKQKIRYGEIFVTRTGKSMGRRQIWGEMKKLCEKAGVNASKVFPHNLRHLFARTFYGLSRDIVKLADVLGHSNIETTRIYLISTGETHARQMERLGLIS